MWIFLFDFKILIYLVKEYYWISIVIYRFVSSARVLIMILTMTKWKQSIKQNLFVKIC